MGRLRTLRTVRFDLWLIAWCMWALAVPALPVSAQPMVAGALEQGKAQLAEDNYEEAYALFQKAIERDPRSAEARYLAGRTAQLQNNLPEAKRHLSEALRLAPTHREARSALAEVHHVLGERAQARAIVDQAAKEGPLPDRLQYLKALLLAEEGKKEDALTLLRQLQRTSPAYAQRAGYQIGLLEAERGETDAARKSWEAAAALEPRSGTAEAIQRSLAELKPPPKGWAAEVGYRFERDSNVVLGPSGTVPGAISREADFRHVLLFDLVGRTPVGSGGALRGEYHFYQGLHHDLTDYNLQQHQIHAQFSLPVGRWTAQLPYTFNWYSVGGDSYLLNHMVAPGLTVPLGRGQSVEPFVKLQKNDYRFPSSTEENRDGTVAAGGVALRLPLAQRGSFVVTYEGGREDTDGVNWENTFHRVEAALRVPVERRWVLKGSLEYLLQDYDNTHTVYLVKREDDAWTLQLGLSYQFWKQAMFHADVAHVRQNSNIAVYDYSRTIYSVGLSWRF